MKNFGLLGLGAAALFTMTSWCAADDVYLTSGGMVSGIVREQGAWITVEVIPGLISFPRSQVTRIVMQRHILHEYYERLAVLGANPGSDGLYSLAQWAKANGLERLMTGLAERILYLDYKHRGAHELLGHVERSGRWMTHEETMREEGKVMFRGEWTTLKEREHILKSEETARKTRLEEEKKKRARRAVGETQEWWYTMGPYYRQYRNYGAWGYWPYTWYRPYRGWVRNYYNYIAPPGPSPEPGAQPSGPPYGPPPGRPLGPPGGRPSGPPFGPPPGRPVGPPPGVPGR